MGAAPMALPRQAGAGGIMMGTPTQPFRLHSLAVGPPGLDGVWQGLNAGV
jgi:hypothetical protein